MKKKLFALLALVMTAMTVSAKDVPTYSLTKADGAEAHGTITFKVDGAAVTSAAEGKTVTMTIAPADNWIVGTVSGQWYAAIAATRRQAPIDLLTGITLTPVQGQDNQWTFTMQRANAEISCTYRKLLTHADISVSIEEECTYTGQPQTPEVIVKDGETELVLNTDFTVSYSNNIYASEATATITGIGNYAGTVSEHFTINKAKAFVMFGMPYQFERTYGDPNFTILPEVEGDGVLTYRSGNQNIATVDEETGEVTIVSAGVVRIWAAISDGANYVGEKDWYQLTIHPKELETSMVAAMAEQAYTGAAVTPGFVITFNDMRLVEGTDYTVEYADNTEIGTATATITGTGNYTGTLTKEFTIAMAKLTLDETEDNSEVLAAADGKPFDVTLKRTLQTGSWNTFAVPFDIDTPDGWTVKELKSSTLADGTLTLSFGNAQGIEAGKPYLVKVADKVETPTFKGVTVSTDFVKTETTAVDFVPTLGKTAIEGDATSILFLGAGNKLFYPTQLPSDMKGFRAYFQLKGDATSARSIQLNFGDDETTSIKTTNFTNYTNSEEWYDLQGRRVNGAAKKGVYIMNGRKVVVK
jgi:hypothetical protein